MKLTEFSVKHNIAVLVFCVGILLMGSYCYNVLPRESFPDVEVPVIMVSTFLDGGNPTDIEKSITIPLETELDGLEGLKDMRSVSSESMSIVSLEFTTDIDIQVALNRVRDAVDRAKPDLAADAEEPVIKEVSFTNIPVLIYHLLGSEKTALSELNELAENIEDDIKQLPGVLDVDIYGARDREVIIEVDPNRLHFYKLPFDQVQAILRGTNRNVSAGAAESDKNRIVMRIPGEFKNPAEIFNLVIGFTQEGVPIYMKDVASVRYDFEDETSRARIYDYQGTEDRTAYTQPGKSVSIQIKKRSGANILQLSEDVAKIIDSRPKSDSVRIVKGMDQSKMVREMVGDLENGIGTSLVLVLVVIFIGLGVRNALLVAAAIPFSMLLSIAILKLTGETLNMMVLFSLILALGMLVDNAIVIIENIYRHLSMGNTRVKAALIGASEVAWPVITSTATTVGAFFPLVFWPDMMGEFMSYLPRTVIVVLICSLFVALVISPTMAAMIMKVKPGAEKGVDPETHRPNYWLVRNYQRVLTFLVDRPFWTVATTFTMLIFVFGTYALFNAGVEFFPPVDPELTTVAIKAPEGVSLDEADRLAGELEARLFGKKGSGYDTSIQNVKYASVTVSVEAGGGSPLEDDGGGPVKVMVEFVDRSERTERTTETLVEMRNRIEGLDKSGENRITWPLYGAEFNVIRPQDGPPTGKPLSIDIYGEDLSLMTSVANDMKRIMRNTAGTVKPTDDAETAQPTIEWRVDRARAGVFGVEQATVSSMLQIAVGGLVTGEVGHGDDEKDIRLRLPKEYRLNTNLLKTVTIPTRSGGAVPIASVATAELKPGPVTIKHHDKKRVVTVGCEVQPGIRNDADIRSNFQAQAENYAFPPDIAYRFGGAAEEQEAAQKFLSEAFWIAVFTILMVMVLQFNSILISGIVLISVILSLMGVLTGLLVIRSPFGIIMTGIGVISLAGIVVNNAIVLLDAVEQFEARGQSPREAVISAAMIRFRPVLLTAITTILGLVPMALKMNFDFRNFVFQFDTNSSQWWQSMALAVIFGLLVSTLLTLGVIPAMYVIYAKIRTLMGKLFGKEFHAVDAREVEDY